MFFIKTRIGQAFINGISNLFHVRVSKPALVRSGVQDVSPTTAQLHPFFVK
jgi:hypothetical protein